MRLADATGRQAAPFCGAKGDFPNWYRTLWIEIDEAIMSDDVRQDSKLTALFSLLFGLVGICVGMICGHSESDPTRVELPVGVLMLFLGLFAGWLIGGLFERITIHAPRSRILLERVLAVALTGLILAPIGWLARDPIEDKTGLAAIIRFFGIGVGIALVFSIVLWFWNARLPTDSPTERSRLN